MPSSRVSRSRREYERRVNRVVDYIESNPTAQLSLDRLARIAAFSPYHFHRVFRSITNETLYGFTQRLRIEKAAQALLASTERSVTEAAHSWGFASAATFARAFKSHFGMSATAWRAGGHRNWRKLRRASKPGTSVSKASKAFDGGKDDTGDRIKLPQRKVAIKALPSYRYVYMRYVGSYGAQGIPRVWERLRRWMAARELDVAGSICLGVAYDNANIAAPDTCRYDACVVVPADFDADRHVNVAETASGRYAISEFDGTAEEIEEAWQSTFGLWLPGSGFEPGDKPCIELYRGAVAVDPRIGPFRCELCLPVRPL
jgi:AraC family transcriptional regulator